MRLQAQNRSKGSAFTGRRAVRPQASTFIGEQGIPESIGLVSISTQEMGTISTMRDNGESVDAMAAKSQKSSTSVRAPLSPSHRLERVEPDASPIQIWEGRVLSVDRQAETMQVILFAKMGNVPEHTGEIEMQWVADQDADLVRPGAVFYLTLYKRLKRGSIENSQELRFRRLPDWTQWQLDQIQEDAKKLLAKMKVRLVAE